MSIVVNCWNGRRYLTVEFIDICLSATSSSLDFYDFFGFSKVGSLHPRSKVPRRLLKVNQERLSSFLFWRKLKNLKALFSLILTSKEVKENAFANKTNELGPAWYNIAGKHHIHGLEENRLVIQIPRHFGHFVEPQERALRFERGQRKCSCIRGQIMPTRNSRNSGNQ